MLLLVLQIVALVFLFLAAINIPQLPQANPKIVTGWTGMFFWLLSLFLGALHVTH